MEAHTHIQEEIHPKYVIWLHKNRNIYVRAMELVWKGSSRKNEIWKSSLSAAVLTEK